MSAIASSSSLKIREITNQQINLYPELNIPYTQKIFDNNFAFSYSRDHANLHDELTGITKKMENYPQLQEIWLDFLRSIHNQEFLYPDQKQITLLDVAPEMSYLQNPIASNIQVTKTTDFDVKDKEAIWEIANESFGAVELPLKESFELWYTSSSVGCLTARDEQTSSILGLLLFANTESEMKVNIVARKANAAKRGIGSKLMKSLIKDHLPEGKKITLCVRESHTSAQTFYRSFGFKDSHLIDPADEACPWEQDLVMIRNSD
ncbi:MAG: hypothetical protein S4CHLAM123_15400 [Chlamydiales bacterium]|nr:hypothetical protein [Chlamydiales bacterium]